ncbi:ABC transporter permease [Nocardioides sp.]|uniref:ABC transporter permease n=1 Tax=Nocardioides sp. TaxID=35761 RepID=UPI002736265E|nr:ABC transporter permease [Nocardioides sp.]MDP3892734.1 ABC transporter permease [Nocardioides sp.]
MVMFGLWRLLRGLLVVLFVTFVVVALMSLAPGSPAVVILGENATPEAVAALESKLGLDNPVWLQWLHWVQAAATGDFGTSVVTNQGVLGAIIERLPVTLEIAVLAQIIALVIAIPLAIVAARRPERGPDRAANLVTSVLLSTPAFVAAPLFVYLFAVQLGWFPVTGWTPISEGLWPNLQGALLPAICVALVEVASLQRILRADLVRTLREDFVIAARAKGLSGSYVMMRHAFRPSSFSLITVAAIGFGRLLGGTIIVEAFFSLPGIGMLVASAINSRDLITVQGVVAFIAIAYVLLNTLVDVGYGLLDPRVRLAGAR